MPYSGVDDMADAARRHAEDARRLLDLGRVDNAVHLAGFAAECALKHEMADALGPAYHPKDHGHAVERLAGRGLAWLVSVTGSGRALRSAQTLRGTPLAHHHPDRRYWRAGWPLAEAQEAVEQAEVFLRELVLEAVLDRGLPFGSP